MSELGEMVWLDAFDWTETHIWQIGVMSLVDIGEIVKLENEGIEGRILANFWCVH